ncbi:MAG: hypothetical protein WAW80_02590 [Candidatus Saccharimonadales bacterium]
MHSINSLLNHLRRDYPEFSFEPADEFWWSAKKQTIFFESTSDSSKEFILHELSHAIMSHSGYEYDIDLIKIERDAWEYAKTTLAPKYQVIIDEEIIQNNLDTYRTWLHTRSSCPECNTTGLQTNDQHYRCLSCGHTWRTNEARVCALRRYSLTTK